MQFRIPNAPRPVRLTQIPGALRRLLGTAAVAFGCLLLLALAARTPADRYLAEQRFLREAVVVPGVVAETRLPTGDALLGTVDVLYAVEDRQHTASRLPISVEDLRSLRQGMTVDLLVDPARPDVAREAGLARRQAARLWWVPWALLAALVAALGVMARELWRTVRADLAPLRRGLLVWLTPGGPLPQTRREIVFPASYYRDDVRHEVRARIRPGRAPVRNGEKVLAVVVPSRPRWARVVDEDLARVLGWWG